jgi:hypothetical protein
MNWYIAKIVFNIVSENTPHNPQFDEQIRLIAGESNEDAFLKAYALGIREEESFLNNNQNKVTWEFINVAEIIPVKNLEDGAELYSCIHETADVKGYIHAIHQKAIFLRLSARPVF